MRVGAVTMFDGRPDRTMADLRVLARHAESVGIDSLWFPEHVVFFSEYVSKYPYAPDGNPGFGRRQGLFDPLFCAMVAFAETQTLRVGTAVLILPQRNPLVLAQEIVALDHASNGRFDFGIGIGWSSEESTALGVPWAKRGQRTDEYLEAMSVLWTDDLCTYHGSFVDFENVIAEPKPVQHPRPPVWVGGAPGPSMARAAKLGDGWYGWAVGHDEMEAVLRQLDAECENVGRDPATVQRKLGLPASGDLRSLASYFDEAQRLGVTEVLVAPRARGAELLTQLDTLATLRP